MHSSRVTGGLERTKTVPDPTTPGEKHKATSRKERWPPLRSVSRDQKSASCSEGRARLRRPGSSCWWAIAWCGSFSRRNAVTSWRSGPSMWVIWLVRRPLCASSMRLPRDIWVLTIWRGIFIVVCKTCEALYSLVQGIKDLENKRRVYLSVCLTNGVVVSTALFRLRAFSLHQAKVDTMVCCLYTTRNPFTPLMFNSKFLLQLHQKYYITQYGELGFS